MNDRYSHAFSNAWRITGRAEGGYINDPSDSGKETNHGITKKTAREDGYTGEMRDLTPARAESIAKRKYWDVMSLDAVANISQAIAREMFDTGYNTGPKRAVKFLQRSLNALNRLQKDYPDMAVDGKFGDVTLNALFLYHSKRKGTGIRILLRCLNGLQLAFYMKLVERREKDERFFNGWVLNRVD
jgi:lysozyme family protein